jgi:hypothetical protein
MAGKKIITVFGATGAQGGGLAKAILNDKNSEFAVRAVTRDPGSDKAKELKAMGAELVVADVDDAASVRKAMEGAYGAFCVTFFWAHFSPEKEMAEAKIMAEAAKATGLKHVIWSTLEDTRKYVPLSDNRMPTLNGKYKVPHFDGKGEADHYFTEAGVPVTFFLASFYWENTSLVGKRIGIAGGEPTCKEMAALLTKALGKEVRYNEVTPETYRSFGFPGADDLGNMFQFYRDFEKVCTETRDIKQSKELNPELQNFETWLKENASLIPLA